MAALDDARLRLREAQERAHEAAAAAQERVREAQERATTLAREAASETQERGRAIAAQMPPGLIVRLASSLVGIPLILGLLFLEVSPGLPGILFTIGLGIVSLIATGEFFRGLRLRGFRPTEPVGFVAVALLQFAAWNVGRGTMINALPAFLAVFVIATLIHQVLRKEPEPLVNAAVTFFGVAYVGWLFSYLIQLRSMPETLAVWVPWGSLPTLPRGAWLTLFVMMVTWLTDTGAYLIGARFGKTKLAPRLSPNKTREGALGGLLFGTIASVVVGSWVGLPWFHTLILGPVLAALGQTGDLCESALKRDLGIKDFGGIMPGHGGVLDRFDSLLFTAPVAYYYLSLFVR